MKRTLVLPLTAMLLIMALSACEKEKGPAEKAGAAIDEAIDKAGNKLEEAGEALKKDSGE